MTGWTSSEDIDLIAPDYVACLAKLTEVPKGSKADMGNYSYTYAELGEILQTIRPILSEHNLAVFQSASSAQGVVCVSVTVLHTSGQWISFDPLCLGSGNSPQSAGSAITYARRYTLLPALGLATEDDDGALASAGVRPGPAAAAAPTRREPTYRSPHEARIRQLLAELPTDADRKKITDSFKEQFHKTLSQLEKDKHEEALSYVEFLLEGNPGGNPIGGDNDDVRPGEPLRPS